MAGAGRLRRRVTLQRPVETQDGTGAPVVTWTAVDTVWANVRPLQGRELFTAQAVHAKLTTEVTIRYRSDVVEASPPASTWRVVVGSQTYELVQDPIDVDDRRAYLLLLCEEAS